MLQCRKNLEMLRCGIYIVVRRETDGSSRSLATVAVKGLRHDQDT